MAPVAAPLAVLLAPVFAPFAALIAMIGAPGVIAAMIGTVAATHEGNKRLPGNVGSDYPDHSEIRFDLANVSPKRRKWTEYLIYIWCKNNGMTLHGAQHPDQEDAAARYIAKNGAGSIPKPWSGETQRGDRPTSKPKRSRKSKAGRGIMREIKSLW